MFPSSASIILTEDLAAEMMLPEFSWMVPDVGKREAKGVFPNQNWHGS